MRWKPTKLSAITDVITKGTTPTTLGYEFADEGIPFLRVQNISDGSVNYERDTLFVDLETHSALKRSQIQPGDVLVSIAGSIGRAGVVPDDAPPMNCNQAVAILRPTKAVLKPFLRLWIEGADAQRQIGSSTVTGTISNLSLSQLGNLEIPLPPLAEQKRIAEVLDRAEVLRAKRRAALAQLDALTQSLFLDLFGDPATNPKGWPKTSLGEIIEFVGGSQPPADTFTYEPSPDTIRLVQIRDFRTDAFKTYIPKNRARRFFEADDVMIGRYGPPVFQILRGLSGSYNVALMKALPRGEILKDFIFHLLQEGRLHAFVVARSERTAGQSGVNLELLEKYPAYLPPISAQREFARRVTAVEALKTAQRAALAELDALFATLQHRAFRGEL